MANSRDKAPPPNIAAQIRTIRGQRVLIDSDLATLYGVTTRRLNEQVRRNLERFPEDFMFALVNQNVASLRPQNATLKTGRGAHLLCCNLLILKRYLQGHNS